MISINNPINTLMQIMRHNLHSYPERIVADSLILEWGWGLSRPWNEVRYSDIILGYDMKVESTILHMIPTGINGIDFNIASRGRIYQENGHFMRYPGRTLAYPTSICMVKEAKSMILQQNKLLLSECNSTDKYIYKAVKLLQPHRSTLKNIINRQGIGRNNNYGHSIIDNGDLQQLAQLCTCVMLEVTEMIYRKEMALRQINSLYSV